MGNKNKMLKLVDTMATGGTAAENFIQDNDFKQFSKLKFFNDIKNFNLQKMIDTYKLKGVVFGNYMTQQERYYACYRMSLILGSLSRTMKSNNIGKGILTIEFGARGRGAAAGAFYPQLMVINMPRGRKSRYKEFMKSDGVFNHEYGHFLDLYWGQKDKKKKENFASEQKESTVSINNTFSKIVDTIMSNDKYMEGLGKSVYLNRRVEIFARTFETVIGLLVKDDKRDKRIMTHKYKGFYYPSTAFCKKHGIDKMVLKIIRKK